MYVGDRNNEQMTCVMLLFVACYVSASDKHHILSNVSYVFNNLFLNACGSAILLVVPLFLFLLFRLD